MGAAAAARPREIRGTVPPRTVITTPRQGGAATSCSARAVCSHSSFSRVLRNLAGLTLGLLATTALAQTAPATPPGTPIVNRGQVQFTGNAGLTTIYSNEVGVVVVPPPSRATLSLQRADFDGGSPTVAQATACLVGGTLTALPPPVGSNGQPFALGEPLPLSAAATVHGGEAVFLDLVDADRNLDAAAFDRIELVVTADGGDSETVVLTETAPDSGRFAGYVQTRAGAAVAGDCTLQVERNAELTARYADPLDATDVASAAAIVDPFGFVFDSLTGAPVDGARVRLVAATSGAPAAVVGDDGVSAYPAEIVTGQPVTDAGGTVYSFPAGVFRFPLVPAGDYRLVVEPPGSYSAPSAVPQAQLQGLPGAPYRLAPGSFGAPFTVVGQIAPGIDIPVDPLANSLFLDKSTTMDVAAIGDFVPYTISVRNTSDVLPLTNVVVTDELPAGMRYQADSARRDGGTPLPPEIGADGRTLTFRLGTLAPRETATLRYVTVIATGAAGGTLVNRAVARADNSTESSSASAAVLLREELFQSRALLLGRVFAGTCDTTVDLGPGIAGVRIYLEDGRYAVTDDEGKYHFEGLTPGSHVVQLDTITLPSEVEPLRCDTRVRNAGNAISQFVDLRGGALGTADFRLSHRAAPTGDSRLSLATTQTDDGFTHTATVTTHGVPLMEAEVLVLLPSALEYVPGSATLDGAPLAEPLVQNGSLRFALGDVAADSAPAVAFATRGVGEPVGDHTIQGLLRFTTALGRAERTAPAANVVHREASRIERISYTFSPRYNAYSFAPRFGSLQTTVDPRDGAELERIAADWRGMRELTIQVVGHADKTPIASRDRDRFPDNYALSAARARAVADYLSAALPTARIEIEGRGAEEPIDSGDAPESLARNRRVEIHVSGVRTLASAEWSVVTPAGETSPVATTGSLTTEARVTPRALASARPAAVTTALEADLDVESVAPQIALLQPSEGFTPPVPTLRVAVAHLPGQTVRLTVNGRPAGALDFDGTESNAAKTVVLSRWRGVDLIDGDNRLVATVLDAAGESVTVLERVVRYGAGGVRAELVPEESLLTADGRTQPVIALRVFDASGAPARPGTLGAYSVDPPYRTWWEVETLRDNPLLVEGRREPTFAVDEDGLVRVLLEPTSQTGSVVVRLRFNERQEQEIRAWLTPEQRDWILVGIAEGTAAYNKISDALVPPDIEDGYSSDGRLAFFAKGRVKGSTLLTVAFDSERDRPLVEDRLFGTIEPDRYYTLYGDAIEQRFEAPTTRKLYLKIERRQFSALFGDFETGLTITELGRYSRALTGFKADFGGERFSVNAFAAENRESFARDELRGDGTSGPYQLSRSPIVTNSDRLRIEIRDRVRSEVVVETRVLTRFLDYSLDYFTGTLIFKQPIQSRDGAFNPVYVIAEYETLDSAATGTTAGARAAARLADNKLEVGATLVGEGSTLGDTTLTGTDLRYRPTGALEVRAEVARTASDDPLRPTATAYLAEVEHVTERVDVQAYVREQEAGFGVGQQQRSELGTRKVGVDTRTKLGELWTVRGEAFRQENLQTGADRGLVSAETRRETADTTASIGLRSVVDDLPVAGTQRSDLLSLGGSVDVAHDRVTLRALTERSLRDAAESLDFPERTTLGLDYHMTPTTTLFTEVEDANGELIDSRMTRVGVRSTPWSGSQMSSSVNRQFSEYGPRVFANLGLTQSWKVGEAWAMDVGVDQTETLTAPNVERVNPIQPLVSGSLDEDYLATFIGAQYRAALWTFTSRFERRDSELADRRSFVGGFFREPLEGRALSATVRWLDNDTPVGAGRIVDARLSYAYRPGDGKFIVLERLDLEQDEREETLGRFETSRFVNNVNLHWQFDNRFEFGTQFGTRYAKSTIDGVRYSGWSTLVGVDLRRDLTPTLDIGLHGTWLDSEAAGTTDRSAGIDVGITAARNLWISVGYNFAGFSDDNFDAARYTADGPYVKFRFKADQDTFKDLDLSRLKPGR
jgi:uncharacterized repeat protein (TIGR01451 family)